MSSLKATLVLTSITSLTTAWIGASSVHAHFLQLEPDSWLNEGADGSPQKGAPCGPKGYDDVSPTPTSGKVTTFHAGESIMVHVQETVHHPGYFRISLAETDAMSATTTDFPDPPLDDSSACSLNLDMVPTGSHDNVLEDGLFKDTNTLGDNRDLMQMVTLPDKPCDHCTLQVVQVMMDHGLNSCFYYHCADITITAADGSGNENPDAGTTTMGTGGTTSPSGSGGTGAAGTGAGNMSGSGGTSSKPMAGSGGTTGSGSMTMTGSGGTSSTSGAGGMAAASGTGGATAPSSMTPDSSSKKDSGCSVVRAHGAAPSAIAWIASALVLGIAVTRVRRHRAPA